MAVAYYVTIVPVALLSTYESFGAVASRGSRTNVDENQANYDRFASHSRNTQHMQRHAITTTSSSNYLHYKSGL